jgi:hypothetical protein
LTLLPPLIPPNDPSYVNSKQKEKTELARRQDAYQRQNAFDILAQYQVDALEAENEKLKQESAENKSTHDQPHGGGKKKRKHGKGHQSRTKTNDSNGESAASIPISSEPDSGEPTVSESVDNGEIELDSKELAVSESDGVEGEPSPVQQAPVEVVETLLGDEIGIVGTQVASEVDGDSAEEV